MPLVLAHAGNVKPSDLDRQLLMTHAGFGQPRVTQAARRLEELNPRLAAMEAIKVLAGFGEPLPGRMVTFDLREMTFARREVRREPGCAVCGGVRG